MRGLNSVTLGGNVVRDSELKATRGGTPVLTFALAVNESRKVDGEWEDYPNFIDCVMYGQRADSLSRFLKKGTYCALVGRIHQNRWENNEGQTRSRIEVVVDEVHFETRGDGRPASEQPEDVYDEDVPF